MINVSIRDIIILSHIRVVIETFTIIYILRILGLF